MKIQQFVVIFSVVLIGISGEILSFGRSNRYDSKDRQDNRFKSADVVKVLSKEEQLNQQKKVFDIVDVVSFASDQVSKNKAKENIMRKLIRDRQERKEAEHVFNIVDTVRIAKGSYDDDRRDRSQEEPSVDRSQEESQAAIQEVALTLQEISSLVEMSLSRVMKLNKFLAQALEEDKAGILEAMVKDLRKSLDLQGKFVEAANIQFEGSQNLKLQALKFELGNKLHSNVEAIQRIVESAVNAIEEEKGRVAEELNAYEARRRVVDKSPEEIAPAVTAPPAQKGRDLEQPNGFEYLKDQDEVNEDARQKASMDHLLAHPDEEVGLKKGLRYIGEEIKRRRNQPEQPNGFEYLKDQDEVNEEARQKASMDHLLANPDEEVGLKKGLRYIGGKLKKKKQTTPIASMNQPD